MRHGPTGAPSPYADLAPPPSSIFTTSAGLRKAAGAKGGSGLCRDTSRPLNVREDRLPPPRDEGVGEHAPAQHPAATHRHWAQEVASEPRSCAISAASETR